MKKLHPALDLFGKMFRQVAASDPIVTPDHFVETHVFQDALTKAGIDHPEGFIQYADWCEQIGLCDFAHKLIRAHHQKMGTSGDPSREAAYRFHKRRQRLGLVA